MMERIYQLVACTSNIADKENARLYLHPTLECELRSALINDIAYIHKEEYKHNGAISLELALKAIRAEERMARFYILTGRIGWGIRYLFFAAKYAYLKKELRHEFVRLCDKAVYLAKKYNREDVLSESNPQKYLSILLDKPQAT